MSASAVTSARQRQLDQQMAGIGIREVDLVERFIRGSGRGGQKINKTASCVYLLHKPSGIEIKCQRERSQALNRFFARRELCEKLAARIRAEASQRQQARERVRRQKRRRSRRAKEKMLQNKKEQAEKKERRRSLRAEE